jgi:DNA-binding XRE family transcriptional regulator
VAHTTGPFDSVQGVARGPRLHLALRIARFFDLPVEAVFSLEPFGPLGVDALTARPASGSDRR